MVKLYTAWDRISRAELFYQKVLLKFSKIHRKTTASESLFNKVERQRSVIEHLWWLLLMGEPNSIVDRYFVEIYKAGTESNIIKGPGNSSKAMYRYASILCLSISCKVKSEKEVSRGWGYRMQILDTLVAHECFEEFPFLENVFIIAFTAVDTTINKCVINRIK